ncbi:alpha/beta hydrolase [Xanthomonas citri pv. fuscans]|uniref:Alpha/beta hydrolase n=1 Tax=Xanthomonas citri pv. fuscans TaxID=366649 RepID=A0AB34Q490_XANCI|nr:MULTISPECIES: alpha/beta hydrolase [Xanthomonas]ATB56904.1 putative non-heme chloroperoxidase [Xanthomonas citri pv. fuscans]ATS65186.1 alpha/beta hydrolase [Xanthomonas citri pv. phaseoli var. fuscans]ATS66972.1 alpha/beta hydrolase [Xanthomonas citri pv. phaseoli var. fuscans]ATS73496.1 alpha/beta hydrolase [Xanthomonas citri pv. phaseoli var. fuscans]ATS76336.1 alpha/beta hydrolase [Xanthomonas citri pv. phaseoli var. fuscans]
MSVRFLPVVRLLPVHYLVACLLLLCSTLAQASPAASAASRSYTVIAPDGVALAVQEHGATTGPAIVFVHGLLGSRINWDAQLDDAHLQRYRLITYDLRGHGLSGKPGAASAYQEGARWADDLAAVLKAASARDAVLVGWSLGGAVISNYLSRHGDAGLAGVVYVDGVIELRAEQLGAHPAIYRNLVSPDLRTHLQAVQDFLRLCFATQPPAPVFETLLANASLASWDMQRAVQGMSIDVAGLKRTRLPVLLMYGARDALVTTEPTLARARQLQPHAQTVVYPNAGHAPFLEDSVRFNQDVLQFVEQLRAAH